jgi:hypothetical protein
MLGLSTSMSTESQARLDLKVLVTGGGGFIGQHLFAGDCAIPAVRFTQPPGASAPSTRVEGRSGGRRTWRFSPMPGGRPDLASVVEGIFGEVGQQFVSRCGDYKSWRLAEMGLTAETYETIAAEIYALRRKGASDSEMFWHFARRELSEMNPPPGFTSASITAIATTVRDIAVDALRRVNEAAEAPVA